MLGIPGSQDRSWCFSSSYVLDLVRESRFGKRCHLRGEDAEDLLNVDGLFASLVLDVDDCANFQITNYIDTESSSATTVVPLAWLNRVVSVKLEHGEVVGVLDDKTLGDCYHIHVTAFPGSPTIAPLPMGKVHGVALVDEVLHVSFCRSHDEHVDAWRWLHQDDSAIWVRELHLESGLSLQSKQSHIEVDDFISLDRMFHMWYESNSLRVAFQRLPQVDFDDDNHFGAACRAEWRMQWGILNIMRKIPSLYVHCCERDFGSLSDLVLAQDSDSVCGLHEEENQMSGTTPSML